MALNVSMREGRFAISAEAQCDLAAFREWAKSDAVPEKARTDFYRGEVWIDMGTEQVFSHGVVKSAIAAALYPLADIPAGDLLLINGILLTNEAAQLSCNPDMITVRAATLDAGRVRLLEGAEEGFTELEGSPDMVLEIVSPGSVTKDTVNLRTAYWEADIPEYWLVDARGDRADFTILRRGPRGYAEVRKVAGWQRSNVFGKSFRLTRGTDRRGNPTFTLEVK
jgi:hypothetical protein